jgi:hypothetical protein
MDCESRHLPERLKVAPYEVRGRVAKNGRSPEGTAEFSLGSLIGGEIFCLTGDTPSVVPVGTGFLSDQSYPGLTVLGYFHAVPVGTATGRLWGAYPDPPAKHNGRFPAALVNEYRTLTMFCR